MATSSLVPSAHTHHGQGTQAGLVETDVEMHAVGPHVFHLGQTAPAEPLVLVLPLGGEPGDHHGDRPPAEPKNSSKAGAKSPELIPCRYINGSTSATLGLFRAHGGMIELRNRILSPVASSTRDRRGR